MIHGQVAGSAEPRSRAATGDKAVVDDELPADDHRVRIATH